jgi:hypothetical protein
LGILADLCQVPLFFCKYYKGQRLCVPDPDRTQPDISTGTLDDPEVVKAELGVLRGRELFNKIKEYKKLNKNIKNTIMRISAMTSTTCIPISV